MRQLFLFLYKLRVLFVFIALEALATWLIVANNNYQGYAFFSSSSAVVGKVNDMNSDVRSYFSLKDNNKELTKQNARLERKVIHLENSLALMDSASESLFQEVVNRDLSGYQFMPATVVNNSVINADNYLTINKGRKDGVLPGMGVISPSGVVGKVKMVSNNFSTAYSLLHNDLSISSMLVKDRILCTTKWNEGNIKNDHTMAELLYIPIDHKLLKGDSVVTSGYNSVYPAGILIGVVDTSFQEKAAMFQSVKINLSTSFNKLRHVYVIKNFNKNEIDSLETANQQTVTY